MFYFIFQKKFKANNAARVAHKFLNSRQIRKTFLQK